MDYYNINYILFALILMRMSGFVFLNPIFARKNVPNILKTGLVIALTMIVFTTVPNENIAVSGTLEFIVLLLKEFATGYVVGFIVSLFSYVIIFAGSLWIYKWDFPCQKYLMHKATRINFAQLNLLQHIIYAVVFCYGCSCCADKYIDKFGKGTALRTGFFGQDVAKGILDIFILCTVLPLKWLFP